MFPQGFGMAVLEAAALAEHEGVDCVLCSLRRQTRRRESYS
jgi:hypothetical protein